MVCVVCVVCVDVEALVMFLVCDICVIGAVEQPCAIGLDKVDATRSTVNIRL